MVIYKKKRFFSRLPCIALGWMSLEIETLVKIFAFGTENDRKKW